MTIFYKLNLNRNRVWRLLEPAEDNDNLSKFIDNNIFETRSSINYNIHFIYT